jgi:hypothetical protein
MADEVCQNRQEVLAKLYMYDDRILELEHASGPKTYSNPAGGVV